MKFFTTKRSGYPGLAASIVIEMCGDFLELGDDLQPRGAVADDGYSFAGWVVCWVPQRAVSKVTLVFLYTRIIWKPGIAEVPCCGNEEISLYDYF